MGLCAWPTAKHTERVWMTWDFSHGFSASVGQCYRSVAFSGTVRSLLDGRLRYFISAIDDTQIYPGPPIDVAGTIRYRF
jgi:hypothetical protein